MKGIWMRHLLNSICNWRFCWRTDFRFSTTIRSTKTNTVRLIWSVVEWRSICVSLVPWRLQAAPRARIRASRAAPVQFPNLWWAISREHKLDAKMSPHEFLCALIMERAQWARQQLRRGPSESSATLADRHSPCSRRRQLCHADEKNFTSFASNPLQIRIWFERRDAHPQATGRTPQKDFRIVMLIKVALDIF